MQLFPVRLVSVSRKSIGARVEDETTWVIQAQQGSDEAFTKIVETYQKPVYNLCYRMLGEPEAAEDAAQETFLRAYQNLHRYDTSRSFGTWILSIAAHYCIDLLRKKKFAVFSMDAENEDGAVMELPDASSPDPEAESVKREQRDRLHLLLKELDATDRAAVIMRYWYDFSEVEIAQSLKLTVSAVKSRLHRSRRALAGMWQEETPRTRPERRIYETPAF
ncbi:MAG: RNA polymerase subunit sigma-24 [Anaerolineales bacterium]|nr:sigma-70 family RNA polymerase sigma factor [Anaerolineae bacterium]PWB70359.1 MAG: RNA polymerase subunit sigma-24 [Anaerolineales bacterium]